MGLYDRDYYRAAPANAGFGHFAFWSVTTWLIVINVAVLFANGILHRATHRQPVWDEDGILVRAPEPAMGSIEQWSYFSTDTAIYRGQVWRFISFQFIHTEPWHLAVNMVGLFLFGPIVEGHFGQRRYLAFYLLCGVAGAVCYLLLGAAKILPEGAATPLIGGSAGIFGLLVAAAMIAPDVQVFYYLFPVTIRLLAIVGMLVAAYTVLAAPLRAGNIGGEAAHLGGGALGFLLMKNQQWLNPFAPRKRLARLAANNPRYRRPRAAQKDWSKDFNR